LAQYCCEHHIVAGLHWNEHIVLTAMNFFSKAQAPGGSVGFALASATEKLAGSATAAASMATLKNDIMRMLVPIHPAPDLMERDFTVSPSFCKPLPLLQQ
jgi:hypothetical protein